MLKSDLLEDISALTTVQKISLDRLVAQACKCICHDIQELLVSGERNACINIGIGNLYIDISDSEIRYRYEPSSKLEHLVTETVLNKKSPIIEDAEASLLNKINTTYKDLF